MNCSFKFHKAGQGCFFTGLFKEGEKLLLNFVFDCGSQTKGPHLNKEIKHFKSSINTKKSKSIIDLLIISNFYEDHINGVIELLKDVKCRNLIIPYISIHERLIIFSSGYAKTDQYRNFLRNPQEFIDQGEYDIDQIYFVDGANNNSEQVKPKIVPIDYPDINFQFPEEIPPPFISEDKNMFDSKFRYLQIPFKLESKKSGWTFNFYIRPWSNSEINNFQNELSQEFPGIKIRDLFLDSNRPTIRKLYRSFFKSINKTSLCVSITKNEYTFIHYCNKPNPLFDFSSRNAGVLLTGDTSLLTIKEVEDFTRYYINDLPRILMFQIPHHGSNNNSLLDKTSKLWKFPLFVINHGSTRKSHPHKDVKKFLSDQKYKVSYNTEFEEYELIYNIS